MHIDALSNTFAFNTSLRYNEAHEKALNLIAEWQHHPPLTNSDGYKSIDNQLTTKPRQELEPPGGSAKKLNAATGGPTCPHWARTLCKGARNL